mgnify:CR=1 FL=1
MWTGNSRRCAFLPLVWCTYKCATGFGAASSFNYYTNQVKTEARRYNVWAIVGFVLSLVPLIFPLGMFSLVVGTSAFVISIFAAKQIKATEEKGNVFAILGIVFGATFMLYGIICALVIFGLLGAYGSVLGYYLNLL